MMHTISQRKPRDALLSGIEAIMSAAQSPFRCCSGDRLTRSRLDFVRPIAGTTMEVISAMYHHDFHFEPVLRETLNTPHRPATLSPPSSELQPFIHGLHSC